MLQDNEIIGLFFARDERAIAETDAKYGRFCRATAYNILSVNEDAEECVNDTYHKAWTVIPPQKPAKLRAWLGKIVRNIALNLWNKNHAQKRYNGMETLMSELEECVPAPATVENELDDMELGRVISAWLGGLGEDDRTYFVLRYWNGMPLKDISAKTGVSADKLAQRMFRLRKQLREKLEKEEISL